MEEAVGGAGVGRRGSGEDDDDMDAEVYCAVGKDAGREWRANLRWVLANFPRRGQDGRRLALVLAHVHRPPRRINMMGAMVPASQLAEQEVAAYRKMEQDKASKALDDLLHTCKAQRVHARKVVVVGDDAVCGLLQIVEDHGVVELVMGAAADRAYKRKMFAPRSKKAATVQQKASPGCRIWFVCKGNLVCTREVKAGPSTASTSPRPSASEHSSPPRLLPLQGNDDGQPLVMHDPMSLRRAPSRDGSNNATDNGAEDSGHEAAAEAAVAEAGPSAAFQPEEPPTTSRHGLEDASEMDDTVEARRRKETEERLAREERRREQPVIYTVEEEPTAAVGGGDQGACFSWLRLSELVKATNSFDVSARIGAAGRDRGAVYRGCLGGKSVAVKIISPDVAVHEARFALAVEAMARAMHPGLVTLVGACPRARALVHELAPGGSLEDRLSGAAPPLPWHARCGAAYRACSALAYLHSTGTVHGDVRPANILFEDARCSSSKLAGLGMSRIAAPKKAGTEALAYVDPRYLATGEPTPQCDVHALGVVLLRLVTGKPASAAKKTARAAAAGGGRAWQEVVDASAGGWPLERATEVAILGLKCCHVSDGRAPARPAAELLEEARTVLEAVTSAGPGRTCLSMQSSSGASDGVGGAPPTSTARSSSPMAGDRARHVADDQTESPPTDELVPTTRSAPPCKSGRLALSIGSSEEM